MDKEMASRSGRTHCADVEVGDALRRERDDFVTGAVVSA
jgi:hypothetical protein